MITNHATTPSKPTPTARMSTLLAPRMDNKEAPPIKDVIKDKKERSKSPTKSKTSKVSSPAETSPKSKSTLESSSKVDPPSSSSTSTTTNGTSSSPPSSSNKGVPGYLRPKNERRGRSKTPPRNPRKPVRNGNKSPLRPTKNLKETKQPQESAQQKEKQGVVEEKKKTILSPKTQQRSDRQNRPSFQGLSVIEGKRKNSGKSEDAKRKMEEAKADRRRKSLDLMRRSAQSQRIKEMLESTMGNYDDLSTLVVEGTAEERLQAVLTKAKERGMNPESIFHFFNGGNPNTTYITKEAFVKGLVKLGDTSIISSNEELAKIVRKFDHNKDGKISIDEFKNYCYEIPTVAWKAERTRLERSGELKKLKAQLSRRFTFSDTDDGHSCGDEVHKTTKFFWKTNNNVDIRLFHCTSLNVITVQLYSQTSEKELPSIYVCKNKIEYQIKNMEQEVEKILQTDEFFFGIRNVEERKAKATWELISKYIVSRLKLKVHAEIAEEEQQEQVPELECAHISNEASCIPFLCKLSGDTFDTLMIQKPLNLKSPPSLVPDSNGEDFEGKMESFRREARKARASRQSAQGLTDLVASALTEAEMALED